jgi:hypothetical protein
MEIVGWLDTQNLPAIEIHPHRVDEASGYL